MRDMFSNKGSKKAMMQILIVLGMISKIKTTRQTSELQWHLIIQACNFITKRLQHRCFPVINAKFLKAPILKNICERPLLKTYPVLLFLFLEDISEEAACWLSSK